MSYNFFEIEEVISTCVECGKGIKSKHYYLGRGPYGICCYKKLFGTLGLIITKHRNTYSKLKKIENITTCPVTGQNKDCDQCLLYKDCRYKNE